MRLSRGRIEWSKKEIVRNIVCSVVGLTALFLFLNKDYLFQYSWHKDDYRIVWGECVGYKGSLFWSPVAVELPYGRQSIDVPEQFLHDYPGGFIPIAYSETRQPALCRAGLACPTLFIYFVGLVIYWNVSVFII